MVDPKMDDGPPVIPIPAALETDPVSRPSSVSTQESAHHGLSQQSQPHTVPVLAVSSAAPSPPQPRPVAIAPAMYASGTSPASTAPAPGGNLPRCENCDTSTTPLWRRDQSGAVLCNACGLFLKLHGRARPKTLKTDVIKSRNRVKTMRPDLAKQKKAQAQAHANLGQPGDLNGADLNGANGARRASQKSANGALDDTNSPISRTGTPSLYASHIPPMYQNLDEQFQAQQLSGFGAHDGRAQSPLNGDRLDMPQTHEQVLATNASLKTRVSELEVIQELYRGRIQQLEQEEASRQAQDQNTSETEVKLRAQLDAMTEAHGQLQKELEESHRRENMLKRRLDELEVEMKDALEGRHAKKARVEEAAANTDEAASTPQSTS